MALMLSLAQPPLATPQDAVDLALADSLGWPDPRAIRYVWVRGEVGKQSMEMVRQVSYAYNLHSQAAKIYRPPFVMSDRVLLVRLDSRLINPRTEDWFRYADAYEEFRFDPKFAGLVTEASLRLAKVAAKGTSRRIVTDKQHRQLVEEDAAATLKRDGVLRIVPDHLEPKTWYDLTTRLQTEAPIVEARYFIFRALSTIKDKDRPLFKSVYGGLYYDLAGIPGSVKQGTDLDALLEKLGVGEAGKRTFSDIFEVLRSDRKTAIWRSGVTGSARAATMFKTLAGGESQGLFFITNDFGTADIDVDQSPVANLLDLKRIKAHEAIWELPNGLPAFALFNGQNQRQDEVPPDVAKDHTIQEPHTARLQPAIGCIRCHGPHDGWIPIGNDVAKLLKSKRGDIVADLSRKDQYDAIDRIVGLYAGDFSKTLRRARDDYAEAVLRATGPWPESKSQVDAAAIVAKRLGETYARYWYDQVGPKEAMEELGFACKGKPEDEFSTYSLVLAPLVIEDPRVSSLRANIKINRSDFDLLYGFIAKPRKR